MGRSKSTNPPKRTAPAENERAERVEEVYAVVLLGAEFGDLRDYATDQGWQATDADLADYHAEALKLCEARAPRSREQALARHLLQRRALYARAMESGDWNTALAVAKDEARLMGLYDREEEKPPGRAPASEAEIVARLAEIAGAIGGERGRTIIAAIGGDPRPEPEPARPAEQVGV